MPTQTELYAAALELAAAGYRVFPLRPGSKGPPAIKGWVDAATRDVEQISYWWERQPDANIGIATGDRLIVLDIDPKHGGELDPLWPPTQTAATPSGGKHLYYTIERNDEAGIKNSVGVLAPGVDVKVHGGYVVAPPSRTPDGNYKWEQDDFMAPLPSWILGTLKRETAGGYQLPEEVVPPGYRNSAVFRYAGFLNGIGYSRKDMIEELREFNQTYCDPPLHDGEVVDIATRQHGAP